MELNFLFRDLISSKFSRNDLDEGILCLDILDSRAPDRVTGDGRDGMETRLVRAVRSNQKPNKLVLHWFGLLGLTRNLTGNVLP